MQEYFSLTETPYGISYTSKALFSIVIMISKNGDLPFYEELKLSTHSSYSK